MKEFKEFAVRGNAIDLAVGIIIGAGFNAIVTALVDHVIMPPLGLLVGGIDFSQQQIVLQAASGDNPAVTLGYGQLVNAIVEFTLIAFVVFLIVRYINKLRRKDQKAEPAAETPARHCPECTLEIAESATRCPHCTAKL